jgi:NADPH-dependent 2,4-dienoyl-CoA reductase/sulfur reductase-like enzyme
VCYERLTIEKDVSCVANPMVGTEFEALQYSEPQLFPEKRPPSKRVLILGAGVSGLEAARIAAGRGHVVEVWEKADRIGGQIHLAIAAPDKLEVEPIWSYRLQEVEALKVPIRTGVNATVESIRQFKPDLVVVATGSSARPAPLDVSALSSNVANVHAWDFLNRPDVVPKGSKVTLVGGDMVGIETADLLITRGCEVTIVEMLDRCAIGMARNNRMEIMDRLEAAHVKILLRTRIVRAQDDKLVLETAIGSSALAIGDCLMTAIGPRPNREIVPAVEAAGAEYVLVGDCNQPGDFLTGIRDAWMVGLSVELRAAAAQRTHAR